jgi:hypothetical protein
MHIRVDRYISNEEATLSRLYIDGVFFCYGLEDQYQEIKIPDETRIPPGTYKIQLRAAGGLHGRYAARYDFHKGMLHLQNVPGFTWVYVHTGNNDDHTSACLLVGNGRNEKDFTLSNSRYAYKRLYEFVVDAAFDKKLTISFEDNDDRLPGGLTHSLRPREVDLLPGFLPPVPSILKESDMPVLRPLPMPDGAPHRQWRVMEDWYLDCTPLGIKFFIPKGFIFNGASVPRIFSNLYPATGYLFIAALIHDYIYAMAFYLEMAKDEKTKKWSLKVETDRGAADEMFKVIANWLYKENWFKTALAKTALVIGGQSAWDDSRKADGTYVKPKKYVYWSKPWWD